MGKTTPLSRRKIIYELNKIVLLELTNQLKVFLAHLRFLVQQFIGGIRVAEFEVRNEEIAVFGTLRPDIHTVADAARHANEKRQSCV